MAISSNATSFLQPSQNAAEVAANEASTGNIALGNSSFDNQNINNRQANNWSDLASYSSGASVFNTRAATMAIRPIATRVRRLAMPAAPFRVSLSPRR